MHRTLAGLAFSLALPAMAWGQASILQGGPWTPGHVPQYVGQGSQQPVVIDGGAAAGGAIGANASEIGIVARGTGSAPYSAQGSGPFGSIDCLYDAPINNATGYHFLCLSPNSTGNNALVSYGAGGTATPGALNFNINGTTYAFPASGTGTGNVTGPGSSTVGHVALWNATNGQLLSDSATISLGNLPSIGANTVLGSIAGGTPAALTTTQLTTLCNAATSSLSGCVPGSGGGTTNFLRADLTWVPIAVTVGTSTVGGGTTQQLLYDNGGTLGEITKCNNGYYGTGGSGIPSCATTLSTLLQGNISQVGTINGGVWNGTPITGPFGGTGLSSAAIGDLIYASATTPTWARLAAVASGALLQAAGTNTAPAWGTTLSGAYTFSNATGPVVTGALSPTGGIGPASVGGAGLTNSPRLFNTCGSPAIISTQGTNTANAASTDTYVAEIWIPANVSTTGGAAFNGGTAAGNVTYYLADSSGNQVAHTASTAMSGTTAYQQVAWVGGPISITGPGTYYLYFQNNGTSGTWRTFPVAGSCGTVLLTGGTYGTFPATTPPTTFTTNVGPIGALY